MRPDQWQLFKAAAKRQNRGGPIPLALIVDCPWIPPYCGVGQWDYFFDVETWFQCNVKVQRDFPDVIWFPSWWSEVGMGACLEQGLTSLPLTRNALSGAISSSVSKSVTAVTRTVCPNCFPSEIAHAGQQKVTRLPSRIPTVLVGSCTGRWHARHTSPAWEWRRLHPANAANESQARKTLRCMNAL